MKYKKCCRNCEHAYLESCKNCSTFGDNAYENFELRKELAKIESGKLVAMPCEVGEYIYVPYTHKGVSGIMKLVVDEIQIAKFQIAYCTDFETDDTDFAIKFSFGVFSLGTYQDLWFTTKEAAEAKLAELKKC